MICVCIVSKKKTFLDWNGMFCSSYFYIETRTETDTPQKRRAFFFFVFCWLFSPLLLISYGGIDGCVCGIFLGLGYVCLCGEKKFIIRSLLTKSEIVNNCVQKSLSVRKPFFFLSCFPSPHTHTVNI